MISANDTKSSTPMKTEKIEYKSEEKTFLISLSYNTEEIIFYLKNTLPFHYDQFESKYNFTELKHINQFFAQFQNMDNIAALYSKLLKNQKIKISENQNEITLSFANIMEDMITLSIKKKEFRGDEKYNKLSEIVNSLINEVKELKDENSKMKEQLNELIKFKNETEEKKKEKEKEKYHNLKNSSIITDRDKMKMISDWIKPNTKIIYNQIYKATRDGGTGQTFHAHCDYKGPTLTLIESKNNYIFGGYITISWDSPKEWTYKGGDNNAFIFSINNKKKYPIQDKSKVIYNHYYYGPDFGSNDIYLYGTNFLENSDNQYGSYSYKAPPNEIAGGDKFGVKELEVYTVQFE